MANRIAGLVLGLILLCPSWVHAQSYAVMPAPFQTALDNTGKIISNACIWSMIAGTTTPATTYADNAGTPNANPIRTDSAGRFTAYLVAGQGYKFYYESACVPPAHGTLLRTADNISGVPAAAATVDITGTAGEALSLGQVVYLSDGSGGKNSGQWYKADSANPYSSTANAIGLTPAAIASGASGSIRIAGSVTGLSSLSVGGVYYVGTAGAVTLTAPTNKRVVGQADTSTSLVVGDPQTPPPPVNAGLVCGRLTLTTAVPVTTADVTAATTLYYTPTSGCNQVTVWNGTQLITDTLTEQSIAVPATTSQMYDVFAFDNAGAINIEVLAWTNDTTRATAISLQNGFLAKAATPARRYVGSFRTSTVSGQTTDAAASRLVWNYYNRVPRTLVRKESTASWTWAMASWQQARGQSANQVEFIVGVNEVPVEATVIGVATQGTVVSANLAVALGLDSTTTPAGIYTVVGTQDNGGVLTPAMASGTYLDYPGLGRHFLAWLEFGNTNTLTYYGNGTPAIGSGGGSPTIQTGIAGWIQG